METGSPISEREIQLVKRLKVQKKGQGEFTLIEKGVGLVRFATPDDIVPNRKEYYNKCDLGGNKFVLTDFSPNVQWSTIVELCKHYHIVVRKNFKK